MDYENVPLPDLGVRVATAPEDPRARYAARLELLDQLAAAQGRVRDAEAARDVSIAAARDAGLSWADIAGALQLDRETVRRRYSPRS